MTIKLSGSDRQELAARYLAGEQVSAIARSYGVSARTVHRWAADAGARRRPDPEEDLVYTGGWVRHGLILRPALEEAS